MLQFIMEQNLLLYLCGMVCAVGVISQFLLRYLYGRLISETGYTGAESGAFVRQLCQRFQKDTRLNEKVNDVDAFTDRSIMDFRFWKMNLHQWRRLGLEALTACLLCCSAGLWLLYRNGGAVSLETSYSRAAIFSTLLILLAYGMSDNRYLHRSLQVRLRDYFQNTGAVRQYSEIDFSESEPDAFQLGAAETASAASRKSSRKLVRRKKESGDETPAQREKRELKDALARAGGTAEIAAAREDPEQRERNRKLLQQMDSKEKEEILREVLLEFLA